MIPNKIRVNGITNTISFLFVFFLFGFLFIEKINYLPFFSHFHTPIIDFVLMHIWYQRAFLDSFELRKQLHSWMKSPKFFHDWTWLKRKWQLLIWCNKNISVSDLVLNERKKILGIDFWSNWFGRVWGEDLLLCQHSQHTD